ncbi:MAG: NlpC/P60 family protein [Verrucomicrobiota bacterium]
MKRKLRFMVVIVWLIALAGTSTATDDEQKPLGEKVKHFFSGLNPFPSKKRKKSSNATPTSSASPEASPTATPEASPTATPTPTPIVKPTPAPNATISREEITEYDKNLPEVRKIIDIAIGLTSLNLDYRYGSADPANGGMDCSGFIYYVLTKCGVPEVPRDAREQYVWVRKAGNFQAVLAQSDDTFELNALQPGDLLFWGDTQTSRREPAITETMIYLGREKGSGQRIMVGASNGRIYKDQPRAGVSVVDFKVAPSEQKSEEQQGPTFVGYGHVPGLNPH